MNKKLTGIAGLVVVAAIIGAANLIISEIMPRVDLTAERLYTLSDGSRAVLGKVDRKVTLKYFFSESAKDMPASLKTYAVQVRDLLREYERAGNGNVVLESYDPKQDSDEEEWATKYGVEPQQVNPFGAPVYCGLVVACEGREEVIAGFSPRTEPTLEYDITRAVTRAAWPERPVVGVLSGIPGVLGEQMNPMMMQMRQQRPNSGWLAFTELKKDYDVREIAAEAETIDADVKTLVVLHPKNLSEKTLFAIDQFVIRGGRLIAFVDPFSFMDMQASGRQQNPMMMQMGGQDCPSTLGKLFDAWGVSFDTSKCVADDSAAVQMRGRRGTVETDATLLELGPENLAKEDMLAAGVTQLLMPYAGALSCTPPEGLTFTPVLFTSTNACLVDAGMLRMGPEGVRSQIRPDGVRRTLAARLDGTFRTAFPKGPDWQEGSTNAVPQVVASGKGFVFLFSDADLIADPVCVLVNDTPFGQGIKKRGDNLKFFEGVVRQFAGREELIGLPAVTMQDGPFAKVKELESKMMGKYREKVMELEKKLDEINEEIAEIQSAQHGTDREQLSPKLEKALLKARQERMRWMKELRGIRHEYQTEAERLESPSLPGVRNGRP